MKLVAQVNDLHIVANLRRVVIFFDKLRIRNQGGDVQGVAQRGNVNRCPHKHEMQDKRNAGELS